MDTKLKAKWVKALRSGKYKQMEGTLHHGGRFCCLGVLAKTCHFMSGDMLDYPPESVVGVNEQFALAALNDDGAPFELIAGFIQENL